MLFLHEVHQVRGEVADQFEAAWREGWMPALATSGDARLLWYWDHAHGSGLSYNVVTVTAVRDGAAWERLAARTQSGDLRSWAGTVDGLRHRSVGKLLEPVPWSPLQEVELDDIPTDGRQHEPSLWMEDTGWPSAPLDDYVRFWGESYYEPMRARGGRLLDIQACFQTAWGAGRRPEAILVQKIVDHGALLHLLTHETAPEHKVPGSYMAEALAYRDQWESRLLRTSRWSPRW